MAYMYPLIVPNPYPTSTISHTFPERHVPFEHARHLIGQTIHHGPHNGPFTPRVDVRETVKDFYLEIELPGLESKEHLSLCWTSMVTLLLKATISRPVIDGQQPEPSAAEGDAAKPADTNSVHLTCSERIIGSFARAFDFTIPVDRDAMVAKLHSGLLRITVPKQIVAQVEPKTVEVQHTDK